MRDAEKQVYHLTLACIDYASQLSSETYSNVCYGTFQNRLGVKYMIALLYGVGTEI